MSAGERIALCGALSTYGRRDRAASADAAVGALAALAWLALTALAAMAWRAVALP